MYLKIVLQKTVRNRKHPNKQNLKRLWEIGSVKTLSNFLTEKKIEIKNWKILTLKILEISK